MICSLKIHNFILIDELELDFRQGFSAITGETGAGKSIILDAILFVFGNNISRSLAKDPQTKTQVAISFDSSLQIASFLQEYEIEIDDEDIIVKRIYNTSSKNKFYINDQLVSKKVVLALMDYVIEIHGQHSHTSLLDSREHMNILDEFAQNSSLLAELGQIVSNYRELEKKIELIEQRKSDIENEIEYLEHNCNELEKANIEEDEAENLENLRRTLHVREKEIDRVQGIITDIEQQEIGQLIARIQRTISQSHDSERFCSIESKLDSIYNNIEESLDELRDIEASMIGDDRSFEEVDNRLHLIKQLARKHNCLPDELPSFLQKSSEELVKLKGLILESDQYSNQLSKIKNEYIDKANKLSDIRKKEAIKLENLVQKELQDLEMNKASFQVNIEVAPEKVSATGIDNVCFLASTNPGMPAGKINEIASGGELSRLMLALRAALFSAKYKGSKSEYNQKMIIFDEIDIGISGSVAESVGARLKDLSKSAQVLVITHQPQVASKANCHLLVEKKQFSNHTEVKVSELTGSDKSKEIARMISGKQITQTGIKAAEELIGG